MSRGFGDNLCNFFQNAYTYKAITDQFLLTQWLLLGVLIISEQRSLAGGHSLLRAQKSDESAAQNLTQGCWLQPGVRFLRIDFQQRYSFSLDIENWKGEEKVEAKQTLYTYHQFKPYNICLGLILLLAVLQKGKHHLSSEIIRK